GSSGQDILDISSSTGTSILHITQAGNVGIGTTTPIATLSLASSTTAAGGINFGDASANLYRSGVGTIKTDGILQIGANAQINKVTFGPTSAGVGMVIQGTYTSGNGSDVTINNGNSSWTTTSGTNRQLLV